MTNVETNADRASLEARFDHHDRAHARDPHAVYRKLRESCPVVRSEQHGEFRAVLGYEENVSAFRNPDGFSSQAVDVPPKEDWAFPSMPPVTFDGSRHRQLRRLLQPYFSPGRVARMDPEFRARARSSIDVFYGAGRCDASQQYSLRIAVNAVAYLLGVPTEYEDRFADWVDAVINLHGGGDREGSMHKAQEMTQYFQGLIQEHRESPKDDLLSVMLEGADPGVKLSDTELLGSVFVFMSAGLDTVWKMIATSLYHLAISDGDRCRLVADPGLIPAACEEFLRFYSPAMMGRSRSRTPNWAAARFRLTNPETVDWIPGQITGAAHVNVEWPVR